MRKLFSAIALAGVALLTSCSFGAKEYKAADAEATLKKNNYNVSVYSETEAKTLITGVNFDGVTLVNALHATKGEGDDKDLMLAFYFKTMEDAEKFNSKNDNENLILLSRYKDSNVGENLKDKGKVGSHNNVAYVGTSITFDLIFA